MFTQTFGAVLLASTVACLVTTAGIYIIQKYEHWANHNITYFISFAAGVLISVSFLHLIPEAFEMNPKAPMFLLGGFMGLYVVNRFIGRFVCHNCDSATLTIGVIPMIGIGLHSFIDGIIYSITFNVSIFTGALAAIGMILHEFPEGVVTFLLLQKGGFSKKKSILWAFLAAALSTPLGTLISYPLISRIGSQTLGLLLSISAGALVYVGATHLLPTVEKEKGKYTLLSLAAGIFIAVLIVATHG